MNKQDQKAKRKFRREVYLNSLEETIYNSLGMLGSCCNDPNIFLQVNTDIEEAISSLRRVI